MSYKNFGAVRQIGCVAAVFTLASFGSSSTGPGGAGPKDPGVRAGVAAAGEPIAGLTAGELYFFNTYGVPTFSEVEAVPNGLGPRFNFNSCAGCHAYPAVGGSSPLVNPQVTQAPAIAPRNTLPGFLSANGPVREVRFIRNSDGAPYGGVHDIFTIVGRPDSPAACAITQPDFSNPANMSFRIPTPVFGGGSLWRRID